MNKSSGNQLRCGALRGGFGVRRRIRPLIRDGTVTAMTKIVVDGKEIDVPPEFTLLQAAEAAGAEIPRFCFHERLSIAGNCRMCLVELKGSPKPVASCAWQVRDCRPGPNGEPPVVNTKTPLVRKAREGVMEFLLINHPLDCPICDQGGECDLQDQAMAYGVDSSRYADNKRAVEDKYIGPLVKTIMNRCIHCTRCIRFSAEVAGVPELGAIGRGEDMEITTYLEQAMTSELQGNVVDLCPVGALTSKPYAFAARPWELSKTESIDVMDAVGSAIRVDARGREVMRILPRVNDDVNEEWISDKTRHVVDGLRTQRLDQPYIRENGRLRPASWSEAFAAVAGEGPPHLAGADRRDRRRSLRGRGDVRAQATDGAARQPQSRRAPGRRGAASVRGPGELSVQRHHRRHRAGRCAADRRRQSAPRGVGAQRAHPQALARRQIPDRADRRAGRSDLQLRLSRRRPGDARRARGGPRRIRRDAEEGRAAADHPRRRRAGAAGRRGGRGARRQGCGRARRGQGRLERLLASCTPRRRASARSTSASCRARADSTPADMAKSGALDVLFLLGADEIDVPPGAFVVYIGTHGDAGAHRADVILPGAAYTEKSGLYVNTEGRVQIANRASFPPGEAREDWAILRALSETLGKKLPFDSLAQLRKALFAAHPHLQRIDQIAPGDAADLRALAGKGGTPDKAPFRQAIDDFYLTNPIARASAVMAECSALAESRTMRAAE